MSEVVVALSILFVAGGFSVLVANRFELPTVPALIVAGLVIGRFLEQDALLDLAIWGIAFLVFVFAIRIDIADLQMVFRDAEIAAFTQLLIVGPIAFAIGYGASVYFEFVLPGRNAIYFAAAAVLSSTLVGRSSLRKDEIRQNLVHGRLASAIHLFDDIIAVGLLLILSAVTLTDPDLLMSQLGYGLIFVLAGLLVYRHGYPVLIRFADGDSELILMGSISILIVFIAAAQIAGISMVVGAFAAGLAIRREGAEMLSVRNGIQSIRDFFVAIFFVTVGALVTTPTYETLVLATALIVVSMIINPLVQVGAFSLEGYDPRTAFLASFSLNQVSELAIVIAIQALLLELIEIPIFNAIILAAAVTMIAASATSRHEEWVYRKLAGRFVESRRWRQLEEHSQVREGLSGHVVIIGFGRHGRRLHHGLKRLGVECVVIENDPVLWDQLSEHCGNYVFGDATGEHPRKMASFDDAALIISTANHRPLSESLMDANPTGELIVRADTSVEAMDLIDSGVTYVIVPSLLAGEQLTVTIAQLLEGDVDAASLQREHLQQLDRFEQAGANSFATILNWE